MFTSNILSLYSYIKTSGVAVWLSVSSLVSINTVTVHQAQWVNHLCVNQPPRSTQPNLHSSHRG